MKLSQTELGRLLGVNRSTVSAWERGIQPPTKNEGGLEQVLGISLTADGQEPKVPTDPEERRLWDALGYMDNDDERWRVIMAVRAMRAQRRVS
jgi:transcriptional regulator with XRE-family HTH domain